MAPSVQEGPTTSPPAAWPLVALTYFGFLTIVAWARPRFSRARVPAIAGLVVMAVVWSVVRTDIWAAAPLWAHVLLPAPLLVLAYAVSGRFYLAPMPRQEAWLAAVDRQLLGATRILEACRRAGRPLGVPLELAYLLVHAMVPAGAVAVARAGSAADLDRYWTAVLVAGLGSYAVLPWVQTRPPRALEPAAPWAGDGVRRLNLALLNHASTGVNTVPSGHAACAVAAALAVTAVSPAVGGAFLALAAAICAGAVLGRYHFLVDAVLGIVLAVAAVLLA